MQFKTISLCPLAAATKTNPTTTIRPTLTSTTCRWTSRWKLQQKIWKIIKQNVKKSFFVFPPMKYFILFFSKKIRFFSDFLYFDF